MLIVKIQNYRNNIIVPLCYDLGLSFRSVSYEYHYSKKFRKIKMEYYTKNYLKIRFSLFILLYICISP